MVVGVDDRDHALWARLSSASIRADAFASASLGATPPSTADSTISETTWITAGSPTTPGKGRAIGIVSRKASASGLRSSSSRYV